MKRAMVYGCQKRAAFPRACARMYDMIFHHWFYTLCLLLQLLSPYFRFSSRTFYSEPCHKPEPALVSFTIFFSARTQHTCAFLQRIPGVARKIYG